MESHTQQIGEITDLTDLIDEKFIDNVGDIITRSVSFCHKNDKQLEKKCLELSKKIKDNIKEYQKYHFVKMQSKSIYDKSLKEEITKDDIGRLISAVLIQQKILTEFLEVLKPIYDLANKDKKNNKYFQDLGTIIQILYNNYNICKNIVNIIKNLNKDFEKDEIPKLEEGDILQLEEGEISELEEEEIPKLEDDKILELEDEKLQDETEIPKLEDEKFQDKKSQNETEIPKLEDDKKLQDETEIPKLEDEK